MISAPSLARLTDQHKALAHPARLRILAMLQGGELCACQITAVLARAASTVSAHLALLRRAGLVTERKQGRWVVYALPAPGDRAHRLAPLLAELDSDPQVRADRSVLEQLRRIPAEELCRVDLDLDRLGIA